MYLPDQLTEILGGRSVIHSAALKIDQILIDSRKIVKADTSLFFALEGKQNAHLFIDALYKEGVRSFVIYDKNLNTSAYPEANFYIVGNTRLSLQELARYHRDRYRYPVIGITGSNGKTVVKDWLYALLSPDHHIVKNPKSYNSQIGVPLSVWQMEDSHTLGIFEAGISKPGEMQSLQNIIQPDIGILTNINAAHDEGFRSREEKLQEKWKLFDGCKAIIYSPDYVKSAGVNEHQERFTWSFNEPCDLQILKVDRSLHSSVITGYYQFIEIKIEIQFTDDASVENAVICWATMLYMKYGQQIIAERMKMLHRIAMRLELKQGINNSSVINDSYSNDINSLFIAVDFLNQQHQHSSKTIILSDFQEQSDDNIYSFVAGFLLKNGVKRIIGIGEEMKKNAAFFAMDKQFFSTTDEFIEQFSSLHFSNETILLKGARKFEFERISKLLEQKVHETVLEINLNALIHNLNFYRSKLLPHTKVMAMVKAFSYGSGSFEIANILQYNRVDYLAVAYVDEGVALRKAGITMPIMVMSPEASAFEAMIRHNLEPEIYNFRILNSLIGYLKYAKLDETTIHLKIDTGMRRLGFEENDMEELIKVLDENKNLKVVSVFSHLAASDAAEHDDFSSQQMKIFERVCMRLHAFLGYSFIKHIANTAAITRFPEAQYDMVRLGIGMYGVDSTNEVTPQLQNVGTLKTTVTQIKKLKPGESVGYSRRGIVHRDSEIATVKIGYADGLSRAFGNGVGYMKINGQKAMIIGSVCMDMCMLDVTGMNVSEGDEVIVFGEDPSPTQLAQLVGTIAYELLTNVSQRVKRIYYYE